MRVALVTPRYPPVVEGGGEQSAKLLATELKSNEKIDQISVFSFDGDVHSTIERVDVHRLADVSSTVTEIQNLAAYPKLKRAVRDFDIIHSYNMELHPAVGHLSEELDIPSVATLNSYHFLPSSETNTSATGFERIYEVFGYPTTGRLLRHFIRKNTVFTALSQAVESVYRSNGYGDVRIEQVPNMFDPQLEVPDQDHQPGFQILYVGTLSEQKGVEYLVRAMEYLPDPYQLRIVGDGPQRKSLEELAVELGQSTRIEFSGQVPYAQIGDVYAQADVFVHPGIWPEPFGRTILEAMQAGLPIVCTDVGAPPELVADDDLIVGVRDPNGLAEAIEYAKSGEVDEQHRKQVLDAHAPANVVLKIIELYSELGN